jgi:hypothetical protein
MRPSLVLVTAFGLLLSTAAAAQEDARGIRPMAGLELTYWLLDGGSYSNSGQSRWGPTARVALRPSPTSPVSAGLALAYASEGSYEPGLAGAALEVALRFGRLDPARRRRINGFFTASLGLLHFDADRQERSMEACLASPGCFHEGGTWFRSGWRPVVGGGIGVVVPVGVCLALQPLAQLVKPFGSGVAGPEEDRVMLHLGVGLGWR